MLVAKLNSGKAFLT